MLDSLTFANIIQTSNLDSSSIFFCSFDIFSLFTNIPLAETIQICAIAFYSSEHPLAPFSWQIFVKLMEMATSSVNGVAMGSPHGPASANIFVGCYESKLFQTTSKLRCISDIWMTLLQHSAMKMSAIFS